MANSVIISSFEIPDLNWTGSTGKLRRYYSVDFRDQDGTPHLAGVPGSLTDPCDVIPCTFAANTLSVPSFSAIVTLFNGADPLARETWVLFDEAESNRETIADEWFIPLTPDPTTREILEIANQGQSLLWPPNIYLNEIGVQALIDAQVPAMDASAVVKGIGYTDVAPAVASAPTFVGVNSPRAKQVYPAEINGFDPSASGATNTTALQTTCDAVGVLGGGTVTVTKPGTYNLNTQGTNPYQAGHKYCIDLKYGNVTLYGGPGVKIQLANGQQTDAGGPVDMFVGRARSNVRIQGAGWKTEISGNAAGQAGWTGGYAQINNGCIFYLYGSTVAGGNSNITVDNIWLHDHFSNPINIDVSGGVNRNTDIRIKWVKSTDCGEGIQVIHGDKVWVTNCTVESPTHVAVGDAFELADCTDTHVKGNTATGHWDASGFDITGSRIVVEDFIVRDCNNAVVVQELPGVPHDITVGPGVITNPMTRTGVATSFGIGLFGDTLDNITVHDVKMRGAAGSTGIVVNANSAAKIAGRVALIDNEMIGNDTGLNVDEPVANLSVIGGSYSSNLSNGISLYYGAGLIAADLKTLHIDTTANDNGGYGLEINDRGFNTIPTILGSIQGQFEGNTSGALLPGSAGGTEQLGLTVNITPNALIAFGGGAGANAFGVKFFSPTGADVVSFLKPSKNQILIIVPTQARTITDRRQAGGVNIDLTGGINFTMAIGDRLALQYEPSLNKWLEIGRSVNGTTIALVGTTLAVTGAMTSSGGGVGYAAGAGGTVTQATDKSTGVTLNTLTGTITTNNAALAAATEVSFVVTNSTVAATDVPVVAIKSGGTLGAYSVQVSAVGAGQFTVTVSNLTAGSLSEVLVLQFVIFKGVAA